MEENKIECKECNREFVKSGDLAMHNYAKHNIPKNNSTEEPKKSNKNLFWMIGIIITIILIYFLVSGKGLTGNATSGDVQKITLGFNSNYYPNTITVEAGKPVEITLDNSVRGCFRSFTIRDLGINYRSSNPEDTIKFTPTKKGTFIFACSMHMGTGTINVI